MITIGREENRTQKWKLLEDIDTVMKLTVCVLWFVFCDVGLLRSNTFQKKTERRKNITNNLKLWWFCTYSRMMFFVSSISLSGWLDDKFLRVKDFDGSKGRHPILRSDKNNHEHWRNKKICSSHFSNRTSQQTYDDTLVYRRYTQSLNRNRNMNHEASDV